MRVESSGSMSTLTTAFRAGTILVLSLIFCVVKQSYLLLQFPNRELSLTTPDEIGGNYLETAIPQSLPNSGGEENGDTTSTTEIEDILNIINKIKKNENGTDGERTSFILNPNSTRVKTSTDIKRTKRRQQRMRAREKKRQYDDDIERAMFVISMGEKAAKTKTIERFVYSARKIGKYSGWIVVLTDASPGRYDGMSNWTQNVIVMEPKEEDLKTHYNVSNMIYKRFKTLAIDYMDRDSRLDDVELVYYLDADIVFGDDMKKAFHGIEKTYGVGPLGANSTNSTSLGKGKMWMFKGNSKKWQIQGGQIILERKRSKPCLERWRKGFDAEETAAMGKDQYLLMDIKAEMDEARNAVLNGTQSSDNTTLDCEIVMMDQKPYIEFPLVKNIRKQSTKLKENPKKKYKYSPMVHVRNDGGTAHMKEKSIRPYMRNLLRFKDGQKDTLGITKKVKMETT